MELFELVLLLIVAVLASALVNQLTSKISAPLVQIVIGIIIALVFGSSINVELEPELFLLLFIAPLLFNEAQHISRVEFWKNKGMILSLALGLVIVTTLAVGVTLNSLMPSIGLAVAFALGATLGPTDPVAVASLSSTAELTRKQKVILSGESLINDASGLVAFQFAIAAALTGQFSIISAGEEFVVLFFGGVGLGIVCGLLLNGGISFLRNHGFESDTFHVLLEVAVPFLVFLLGEELHVSGILAVVACGIIFSISHGQAGYTIAKTNILSNSVWDLISFSLNGIVFVLLGIMLPGGMMRELEGGLTEINYELIGMALLLTGIVIGVRFLWCIIVERFFRDAERVDKGLLRHSAILSFSGAKGAITLSLIMTVPYAISVRSELVFMASVVIIATLVLANFIVPILAPAPKDEYSERYKREMKYYMKSLRRVVERLTEEMEDAVTLYDKAAYQAVIREYADRIDGIREDMSGEISEVQRDQNFKLRVQALEWQQEKAKELLANGEISENVCHQLLEEDEEAINRLENGNVVIWTFNRIVRKSRIAVRDVLKSLGVWKALAKRDSSSADFSRRLRDARVKCQQYAADKLFEEQRKVGSAYPPELIGRLVAEYQRNAAATKTQEISVTKMIYSNEVADDIRLRALGYEHDFVNDFYNHGDIDRKSVNALRRRIAAIQMDIAGI